MSGSLVDGVPLTLRRGLCFPSSTWRAPVRPDTAHGLWGSPGGWRWGKQVAASTCRTVAPCRTERSLGWLSVGPRTPDAGSLPVQAGQPLLAAGSPAGLPGSGGHGGAWSRLQVSHLAACACYLLCARTRVQPHLSASLLALLWASLGRAAC